MKPRLQVSRAGVVLIKRFEGLRTRAAQLEDGRWTLGYGHTRTAREGAVVSEPDAEALLLYDLINVAHAVNEWVHAPLNQNQFDALVSFAFNIGLENFRRSTTLRRLNEGRPLEAALAMELWRRADFEGERIVIDALVRRRAYEKTLFLKPVDAFPVAPSSILPPRLDYDAGALTPSSPPQAVTASLQGDRAIAAREVPALIPVEDAGPSASEMAAAAVTARLEAILPHDEPAEALPHEPHEEPREAFAAVASPETSAEPDLPFPHQTSAEHEAPRDIEVAVEDAAPAEPAAEAAAEAALPRVEAAPPARAPVVREEHVSIVLLAGLAFVGMVLFFSAVKWGFSPTLGGASPLALAALGWVAGALGVICFSAAAYFLIIRLGGQDALPPAE